MFMREIFDRHHEKVRQFVLDHPSHALVEVPILDPNAGKILGDAFGLDATYWGQVNGNQGGRKRTQIAIDFLQVLFTDNFEQNPVQGLFFILTVATTCSLVMILTTLGVQNMYRNYVYTRRR